MAAQITVEADEIKSALKNLSKRIDRGQFTAINRSLVSARAFAVRDIRKDLNLKARYIRQRIKINRAKGNPAGSIDVAGSRGIGLHLYGARQVGKRGKRRRAGRNPRGGISVRIYRGRPTFIPQGFLHANRFRGMPFVRVKRGGDFVGRMPIRPLLGPSVAHAFAYRRKAVTSFASERVRIEYERIINLAIEKERLGG